MTCRIGQMEQMDLSAPAQIQTLEIVTQYIDLHVAVGDTLLDLLRHPLTPLQDPLVVVSLDAQDIQPREPIPQIHCVCGKSQDLTINPALDQEAQRLLCIVEGGEGDSGHALEQLHRMIAPFLLRRLKKDVLKETDLLLFILVMKKVPLN